MGEWLKKCCRVCVAAGYGYRHIISDKAFDHARAISGQKHVHIKLGHCSGKLVLEVITIRHISVDFHPCEWIVAAFQQAPADIAATGLERTHAANLGFGLDVVVLHPLVTVNVVPATR